MVYYRMPDLVSSEMTTVCNAYINNVIIFFKYIILQIFCQTFEKDQDLMKLIFYLRDYFTNLTNFLFKKLDFFTKISNENNIFVGIPSIFEILKVFNHYNILNDQKLQINLIFKTWVHIIDVIFCNQMKFSSIFFDPPATETIIESKNTIYEEDNENEYFEDDDNTKSEIKTLEEIEINNPIKIDTSKKRKKGVHQGSKKDQKFINSLKGVSFKDIKDDDSFEKSKERSRATTFDRSFTFESDLKDEALDADFLQTWIQNILTNLNEHMSSKELKKIIYNKENIRFFNEELFEDNDVIFLLIHSIFFL